MLDVKFIYGENPYFLGILNLLCENILLIVYAYSI